MRQSLIRSLSLAVCAAGSLSSVHAADDLSISSPVPKADKNAAETTKSTHSWELPPITVQADRGTFRDDDLVGSYGQPRWSTRRRFSEVRTYVIPGGQFEFEYWLFVKQPSKSDKKKAEAAGESKPKAKIKQQYEAEIGLGHRFQLDLYQVYEKDGSNGNNALDATKFELRYALADWDRIWGNPTLYAEWKQAAQGADSAELKLLLCGDIAPRWAWATNFVWEQQTGDYRERSLEWNSAVGYNAIDQRLSVGVETAFAQTSALRDPSGGGRESQLELAAGPSIRFYPIPQAHVILSEFLPLNNNASAAKTAVIVGWEF